MNDYSLIEKIQILMDMVASSPLFFACSVLAILFLIFIIICILLNKKINKWILISIVFLIIVILIINYNQVVFKMIDIFFDSIFMVLYFPNISVYILFLVVSNIFFLMSLFKKNMKKPNKIVNIICTITLNLIMLLVIDTVSKNNIDIYKQVNIYSNTNLLVLLELSSAIFVSWILLSLFILASHKLKKYDKKKYPEMEKIIIK